MEGETTPTKSVPLPMEEEEVEEEGKGKSGGEGKEGRGKEGLPATVNSDCLDFYKGLIELIQDKLQRKPEQESLFILLEIVFFYFIWRGRLILS